MRAVFHRQRLPAGCRGFGIVNLIRRTGTEAIMNLGLNSLDIRSTESAIGAVVQTIFYFGKSTLESRDSSRRNACQNYLPSSAIFESSSVCDIAPRRRVTVPSVSMNTQAG